MGRSPVLTVIAEHVIQTETILMKVEYVVHTEQIIAMHNIIAKHEGAWVMEQMVDNFFAHMYTVLVRQPFYRKAPIDLSPLAC